jgi:hypothetical protein
MMRRLLAVALLAAAGGAQAASWEWSEPVSVGADPGGRAFVHLEAAGRKSIAESAGWVAITWEDDRDGMPRCYVALKAPGQTDFGPAQQVSGVEEGFEPAVVGLGGGRFALAWEEGGRARARVINAKGLGQPLQLSTREAAQASLGFSREAGLFAVWSEKEGNFWRVAVARLTPVGDGLKAGAPSPVEPGRVEGDQSYPSIAALGANKVVVAWEDRRAGHTLIMDAVSSDGGKRFTAPKNINDIVWRGQSAGFGRGTGVMRVALSRDGAQGVVAVWADKRDFLSAYDVYAAFAQGPAFKFGANEKVQDEFGNNIAQWHPAIAANAAGQAVAVWDDDRDGTPDIWLSWRDQQGWSDDLAVPGASGPGVQSDPSIAMDEAGNLYVAWVEKGDLNAPSSIRYVFGRLTSP